MINTVCGTGSTGRICTEIAEVLKMKGHECFIAYGQGKTSYEKSYKIGDIIENHLHNAGSRIFGKQGYFSENGTKDLVEKIKSENPDVIHLHNLHGNYLHLETLFGFLENYKGKIVWTLHDCWVFTGKCSHYTDVKCYKWKNHCKSCPQVKEYPPSIIFDRSEEMFDDKWRWYKNLDINVVSVSDWLLKEASQSVLLKDKKHQRIYNWVNHDVFKPGKGVISDKKNILFVSAFWNEGAAKTQKLVEICKKLQNQTNITVLGKIDEKFKKRLPNVNFINHINGIEKMAEFYNDADVYVHLSTEDTFGLVMAEAMSCGTPVIAINSTACGEVVGSHDCGRIVDTEEIFKIEEAILEVLSIDKSEFFEKCRNRVLEMFSKVNIKSYLEIYSN